MRRTAVALLLLLAAACGRSADGKPETVILAGDRVAVAPLLDAHAALCEASAAAGGDASVARATFFDRAHDALHTVARGLEEVSRASAAELLEAKEKVESGLDTWPPTLPADIARLADVYRAGLGRLAISAPPCE